MIRPIQQLCEAWVTKYVESPYLGPAERAPAMCFFRLEGFLPPCHTGNTLSSGADYQENVSVAAPWDSLQDPEKDTCPCVITEEGREGGAGVEP